MTHARTERHVYLREMTQGVRTSLSVLAGMITPGARVLDLGTGSGALGQFLGEHSGCVVDGVTINEAEAELARPHYRRVELANLEQPDWASSFGPQGYDFIVCADVLEHLRDPAVALRACAGLLAADGQLLISVPNAAYSGLLAELLRGDFIYRDEGLLDRTHLRFFTRRSLREFLAAEGWTVEKVEPIELPFIESEFRPSFEQLPPAVARYLLALPDAGTYQLVVSARPATSIATATAGAGDDGVRPQAVAHFSAQLYVDDGAGFREDQKIIVPGVIGQQRQLLRFPLPAGRLARLRLDPADRPGFLHLHRICLRAAAEVLWQWSGDTQGLEPLAGAPHHDMLLRAPWPSGMALVLLHGDDPYIELPVPPALLEACEGRADVALEVELGWPMSGDFMALSEVVHPLEQQRESLEQQRDSLEQQRNSLEQQRENLEQQLEHLRAGKAQAEGVIARATSRIEQLDGQQRQLSEKLSVLTEHLRGAATQNQRLAEENKAIARAKLALEGEVAILATTREQLRDLSEQHVRLVKEYGALGDHLRWIENSTVFRATRPLVHAKMALDRMLGRRRPEAAAPVAAPEPALPRSDMVDVIVPVYRGLEDTQRCIRSVLASRCRTPWRLVILNDASPEPEVTGWLRQISGRDSRILLLENEHNLGFVATVNRGMAMSEKHDVLLLNSDTEVANDWLDRLRRTAYSDARVASVTPFSNNATICSYPRFCEPNELPPGWDTERLDALFAGTNAGEAVDVPTGVGFCMYIRRDSLAALGLFDVENFGKGYGEENDFCRRAAEAGWRNLHALDTFVLHTGGVSFGDSKSQREIDAVAKLRRMHPSYDALVHDFVTADPARPARLAVDLARVRSPGRPSVLAVVHNRGGGTRRHVVELAEHLADRATFFCLTPVPEHGVCLELLEAGTGFKLEFALPGQWHSLLQALRSLTISHIHYHHVLGHAPDILQLGAQLGVSWDFTAHDYYMMCPNISLTDQSDRYCGEQGEQQCTRCLESTPAPDGGNIASWRAKHGRLLAQARHVLVPSRDAARRFARMWPAADVRLAPHTDIASSMDLPVPDVPALAPGAPLRVAVIGAISRIKGADLLEDVAVLAAQRGSPLEFHLIGFAYRDLRKQPQAALTVHGAYEEEDLPKLLSWLKPDAVWFPALWPETYSYTLSACLVAGLPVIAPSIGAFAERLTGRPWSWVRRWDSAPAEWLDFFVDAREQHFATGVSPPPPVSEALQIDERIKAWSYDADYLQGLQVLAPSAFPEEFLLRHRPGQARGLSAHRKGLKRAALSAIVRLRAAPALRSLARVIPHQWQSRVKSWLVT